MPDPVTLVTAELIARLEPKQFEPFTIIMSDGSRHHVPSRDHCTITRLLRRIEVESDAGNIAFINPLHIAKIETQRHDPAA